jgi:hypothetical protein
MCPSACQPAPNTPATLASGRASHWRRQSADRTGADHAEIIGLDHRLQLAAGGIKQMNQKAVAAAIGGVGLVADHTLGRQRALQDVQDRLRQAAARPWRVLRLTERQIAMCRLDPSMAIATVNSFFTSFSDRNKAMARLLKR